jgi:PKD repeat protein
MGRKGTKKGGCENMKQKLIILILIITALIIPVFASNTINVSYATYDEAWLRNTNISTSAQDSPATTCGKYGLSPWSGLSNHVYTDMVYYTQSIPSWGTITTSGDYKDLTYSPANNFSFISDGWYYPTGIDFAACDRSGAYSPCAGNLHRYYNGTQYMPVQPEVNFTGAPTNGSAPMMVNFAIVNFSSGVKSGSSQTWDFGDGSIVMSSSETNMHQYQTAGTFSVSLTYQNLSNTSLTISKSQYIRTTNQSGLTLHLEIRDVESKALIGGSTAGLKNITSGSWWNFTTSTGLAYWRSTDVNGSYPLSVGQVVTLGANASGYDAKSSSVTIPYDDYREQIFLTRTAHNARNGTWNLIVLVKSNKYGTPINSATVNLITGVNEDTKYQDLTDDLGTVTFMNVTPSTSALVDAIAQGYQYGSAIVTVIPNSTQRVTIELVKLGETPVATPIATPNKTPYTGVPTPQITGPNGEPITSPEGKAQWGLDQLFNIIPQVVMIVISIIFMWLFWRAFDIATNGVGPLIIRKVIEGFIRQMFK